MDALRERGVAAAALAPTEAVPQGDEEADSEELASKTCTWPPPEAEYFFGEKRLRGYVFLVSLGLARSRLAFGAFEFVK